jgi:endothelin-converting enzyme/putative endopeptidase
MLGFLGEKPAEAKIHAEQILALEIMSKPRFDQKEETEENRITDDRRRLQKN